MLVTFTPQQCDLRVSAASDTFHLASCVSSSSLSSLAHALASLLSPHPPLSRELSPPSLLRWARLALPLAALVPARHATLLFSSSSSHSQTQTKLEHARIKELEQSLLFEKTKADKLQRELEDTRVMVFTI